MPRARREITIGRPVGEVFAFVSDAENDPQWRTAVLDVERVAGDAPGVGARYRQGVKGPFGRRTPADIEVTEFEPERKLAFRVTAGPVRPEGRYELAPAEGSGTRLIFELWCELTGLKKLLMSGAVQKSMDAEMANLDELKRVLESR
jgi:uncharacterized protein YndB with AHSA1/START domain